MRLEATKMTKRFTPEANVSNDKQREIEPLSRFVQIKFDTKHFSVIFWINKHIEEEEKNQFQVDPIFFSFFSVF